MDCSSAHVADEAEAGAASDDAIRHLRRQLHLHSKRILQADLVIRELGLSVLTSVPGPLTDAFALITLSQVSSCINSGQTP